jgi:hypothetical protein
MMEFRAIIRTVILVIGGLIVLGVLLAVVPIILLILFIWSLVAGKSIGELLGTRIKRHVQYAVFGSKSRPGTGRTGTPSGKSKTASAAGEALGGDVIDVEAKEVKND